MSSIGIYSKDLRSRAVEAVEQGIPRKDVVETFSISYDTQTYENHSKGCADLRRPSYLTLLYKLGGDDHPIH